MTELAPDVLARSSTPDLVESRIGTLDFADGAPSAKILRLFSPLAPFFDNSWRVGEIRPSWHGYS